MTQGQPGETDSSWRASPLPVQVLDHERYAIPVEDQVESFLRDVQGQHPDLHPRLFTGALRSQSFDFVTALLDKLETLLSGQYSPLDSKLLHILVADFGWDLVPLYPSEDEDFPHQAYQVQRPPREWETQCRNRTTRTQNLRRPALTENMKKTLQEAREYLYDDFMSDPDIIHALTTRGDDFAEALFDLLEVTLRLAWVDPRRPLIQYLLEMVGWEVKASTPGPSPKCIMVRPSHHMVELSPDGMWVAASWNLRTKARRAWESGDIGEGESYQTWYQAQLRTPETRATEAEQLEAWVAKVRARQTLKRNRKAQAKASAQAPALSYGETGPNYDAVLQKLSENRAKLEGRLEHVGQMQIELCIEAAKLKKQISNVNRHMVEVEKVKFKSRIPRPVDPSGRWRRSV